MPTTLQESTYAGGLAGGAPTRKVFWFDTETTGTTAGKHEAHQIAYVIEIDGKVAEDGQLWVQPTRWEAIELEALAVSGVTLEVLKTAQYEPVAVVHRKLTAILARHVNKFDRKDKFYPAGYNVRFDYDFLQDLFRTAGDNYFGSWFNHKTIDPLPLVRALEFYGLLQTKNLKLGTVYEAYMGKPLAGAHDAISDVHAVRDLFYKMTFASREPERPYLAINSPRRQP